MAERRGQKLGTFVVQEFLDSQNVELIGSDPERGILVRGPDGQEGTFEPMEYLRSQGVDPAQMDIELNTPDTALPESPVGMMDRAFLSMGNAKGQISYLKKKFNDARMTENGLVVKEGNTWKQVDPSALSGDGWTITEAIKDVLDLSGDVPVVAGAGVGAAAGAGVASVAGAGAGAGVGEGIRTSLGRLVGTYDATPVEQLEDIGIETALGLGGQAIALGARPAVSKIGKSWKFVKKEASDAAKDIYTRLLGTTTGVGAEAMEFAVENPATVQKRLGDFIRMGDTASDIGEKIRPQLVKQVTKLLDDTSAALPKKYEQLLDDVMTKAEARSMTVNVGDVVERSMKALEKEGLGKLTTTRGGKLMLRPFSPQEVAERLGDVENLTKSDLTAVNEVLSTLNQFSGLGTLRGKAAARTLANINKGINKSFQRFQRDPQLSRIGAVASAEFKNGVNETFERVGLGAEWAKRAELYGRYSDAVNWARKTAQKEGNVEGVLDRLLKEGSAANRQRGALRSLIELSPQSAPLANDIIRDTAALRFVSWVPSEGLVSRAANFGAFGALFYEPTYAATMLASTSPRIAAEVTSRASQVLPYAWRLKDFATGLPTRATAELLKNEDAVRALFQTTLGAAAQESQNSEQIVQGLMGGQNGQ